MLMIIIVNTYLINYNILNSYVMIDHSIDFIILYFMIQVRLVVLTNILFEQITLI